MIMSVIQRRALQLVSRRARARDSSSAATSAASAAARRAEPPLPYLAHPPAKDCLFSDEVVYGRSAERALGALHLLQALNAPRAFVLEALPRLSFTSPRVQTVEGNAATVRQSTSLSYDDHNNVDGDAPIAAAAASGELPAVIIAEQPTTTPGIQQTVVAHESTATLPPLPRESRRDLVLRQLALETEQLDTTVNEYRETLSNVIRVGRGSSLPVAQRLVVQWFAPLCKAIDEEQAKCRSLEPGVDRSVYGRQLILLPPEKLAVITMHQVLNMILLQGGVSKITPLALEIGRQVEAEIGMMKLRFGHRRQWSQLHSALQGREGAALRRNARAALHSDEWTTSTHAKLGALLITLLCTTARVEVLRDGSLAVVSAALCGSSSSVDSGDSVGVAPSSSVINSSSGVDSATVVHSSSGSLNSNLGAPSPLSSLHSPADARHNNHHFSFDATASALDVADLPATIATQDPVVAAAFGLDPRPWFDLTKPPSDPSTSTLHHPDHPRQLAVPRTNPNNPYVSGSPYGLLLSIADSRGSGGGRGGGAQVDVGRQSSSSSRGGGGVDVHRVMVRAEGELQLDSASFSEGGSLALSDEDTEATVSSSSRRGNSRSRSSGGAGAAPPSSPPLEPHKVLLRAAASPSLETDPITGATKLTVPAFQHVYLRKPPPAQQTAGVLLLHPRIGGLLSTAAVKFAPPTHLPMILPPRDWRSLKVGGYLKQKAALLRLSPGAQAQQECVRSTDMRRVFAALNALGSTPWRINTFILRVVKEAWVAGGGIAELPPAANLPLPPEPQQHQLQHQSQLPPEPQQHQHAAPLPTDPKLKLDPAADASADPKSKVDPAADASADPKLKVDPAEVTAAMRKYRAAARYVQNTNTSLHSLRCDLHLKLAVADKFAGERAIYFPFNMDFRGRVYPIPPHLNHMGSDLCRGLLQFAEAKPLGAVGLRWLKIHLANQMGRDKLPFDARVAYTEEHVADAADSFDAPLTGRRWWLGADNPWQALAAIRELTLALRSEDPHAYVCALPVQLDGSCNGLQHYAALGRDEAGGRAVNLVPAVVPISTGSVSADSTDSIRDGSDSVVSSCVGYGSVFSGTSDNISASVSCASVSSSVAAAGIVTPAADRTSTSDRPADVYSTVLQLVLARMQVDAAITDEAVSALDAAPAPAATSAAAASPSSSSATQPSAPSSSSASSLSAHTEHDAKLKSDTGPRVSLSRKDAYMVARSDWTRRTTTTTIESGTMSTQTSSTTASGGGSAAPALSDTTAAHSSAAAYASSIGAKSSDVVTAMRSAYAATVAMNDTLSDSQPPLDHLHAATATQVEVGRPTASAAATGTPLEGFTVSAATAAAAAVGAPLSEDAAAKQQLARDALAVRRLAARFLLGHVDRKVVKQTVMTSVYGVTYFGAREQILNRLKEKFPPDAPHLPPGMGLEELDEALFVCASYLARVTLASLGDLFRSADDIKKWLSDTCKAVTSTGQPMAWITPLGLPVLQPYRREHPMLVRTVLQDIIIADDSEQLPVSGTRQRSAFPPNFVHSLDSTHMMLTALDMRSKGLTFTAVHDSYWTHAGDTETMAASLREQFIALYSQPLMENLRASLVLRFPGITIPELPPRGSLQLEHVRHAKYFFS